MVDDIVRYECGEMDDNEVVVLFAYLIKTGMAWQLQGHYGRMARDFIEAGLITEQGEVTEKCQEILSEVS